MKIFQFIGTRPELIKLAPIEWAARNFPELTLSSYFTGQHVELVEQLASELDINFRLFTNPSASDASLSDKVSSILAASGRLIADERPDLVIVQGDTASALACALAASCNRVPVAHVEAGLRSFDRTAPWPEENLRRQLTQIADVHFAPTDLARENLIAEGVSDSAIRVVGNTVIDSVRAILANSSAQVDTRWTTGRKIGILTMHRREMLMEKGAPNIIECVRELSEKLDISFIFPVHPSPVLRQQLESSEFGSYIKLVDPIQYPDFIRMLHTADLVVTDSGGIQEEATFLKIPTLCLRGVTERPEAVSSGAVSLVGSHPPSLVPAAVAALARDRETIRNTVFGTGDSAERILDHIVRTFGGCRYSREDRPS
ncbi:MAG: UDP-N-acetylglucosamine 2-epimerase (non-hydrolyzing) [Methylobacterium frigidaeris]